MRWRWRRGAGVSAAAGVLFVVAGRAQAWDSFGHMEVAAVAYEKLAPKTKRRVAALLKLNPSYTYWIVGAKGGDRDRAAFMKAATWADSIKDDPAYTNDQQDGPASRNVGYADKLQHRYWHFIDRPFSPDGTPLIQPKAPNAATQIALFRSVLGTAGAGDDLKSYDLVWLLHLVGDVHQPLHCVSRFDGADPAGDRGGNAVRITGNTLPAVCEDPRCSLGPPANLHAFYDDIAGAGYATAAILAAAATLPAADAAKAAILDETVWTEEGLALATSRIYVAPIGAGDGPFTIDRRYQSAALALGKQRIALAGARLANLLDDCFAREAGAAPPR
jgi:hypothetical protein